MEKNKTAKTIIAICVIALFVAMALYIYTHPSDEGVFIPAEPAPSETAALDIHMLDVGEGLSVLIDAGEYEVLIDGGYAKYGEYISGYIKQYIDGDIEYIISTHSDSDHVGGLTQIYKDYQVNHTIYGDTGKSQQYKNFEEAARDEPSSTFENDKDEVIDLGDGVTLKIIDVVDDDKKTNNNSVISLLDVDGIRVLITGDAEAKTEKLLLGMIGEVDVYVVGHHGSETSSSQAFLDEIRPKYGLISSEGPEGKYKNPDKEVMQRLLSLGTTLYATYRSGEITISIDYGEIHLSPPEQERLTLENYEVRIAA